MFTIFITHTRRCLNKQKNCHPCVGTFWALAEIHQVCIGILEHAGMLKLCIGMLECDCLRQPKWKDAVFWGAVASASVKGASEQAGT